MVPESSALHTRPGEMRAALEFTAAETGFSQRIIEKDYWCSLVLRELAGDAAGLVFKGGTLLSKAFTEFHRLSEDLDFTLPTVTGTPRAARSARARVVKSRLDEIADQLGLTWADSWRGHNKSTQYRGRLKYPATQDENESLLIEVGLREDTAEPPTDTPLHTLLLEPLFGEAVIEPFAIPSLSMREAYAEKVRAALTRPDPAIRDLFDLRQAKLAGLLPLADAEWIAMVRAKCSQVTENPELSEKRVELFRSGIEADLLPMLRATAGAPFDFDDAMQDLQRLHALVTTP